MTKGKKKLSHRFKGNLTPRFRLCSSYVQDIVNEIVLRTDLDKKNIVFEPNARIFSFGAPRYSSLSSSTKPKPQSGNPSADSELISKKPQTTPSITQTIFKDCSDETKQAIDQQERDLDEIDNIVGDLHGMALTLGSAVDEQNQQLDRLSDKVDLANARLKKTTKKIDKQL